MDILGQLNLDEIPEVHLEQKHTCGTCDSFGEYEKSGQVCEEGQFRVTSDSMCFYTPCRWHAKLPNPEAQLKGLREKLHDIAGIDRDQEKLRLLSKLELLELKIRTLLAQLEIEKKRSKLYERNNIELRGRLIRIKRETVA